MGSLPREKAGVGSAVNDTTRQMGGALGVAIIGSVVSSVYAAHISDLAGRLRADGRRRSTTARGSLGGALEVGGEPRRRGRRRSSSRSRTASSTRSAAACASARVVILGAAFVAWRFLPARAHDPLAVDVADERAADAAAVAVPVGGRLMTADRRRDRRRSGRPAPAKRGRPRRADADEAILDGRRSSCSPRPAWPGCRWTSSPSAPASARRRSTAAGTPRRRSILDALRTTTTPIPAPDEGTVRDDLFAYTDAVVERFGAGPRLRRAAPPDRGQLLRRAAARVARRVPARPPGDDPRLILQRGIERGELAGRHRRRPRRRRHPRAVLLPPPAHRRARRRGLRPPPRRVRPALTPLSGRSASAAPRAPRRVRLAAAVRHVGSTAGAVELDGVAVDLPQHGRVLAVPAHGERHRRRRPDRQAVGLEVGAAPRVGDAAGQQHRAAGQAPLDGGDGADAVGRPAGTATPGAAGARSGRRRRRRAALAGRGQHDRRGVERGVDVPARARRRRRGPRRRRRRRGVGAASSELAQPHELAERRGGTRRDRRRASAARPAARRSGPRRPPRPRARRAARARLARSASATQPARRGVGARQPRRQRPRRPAVVGEGDASPTCGGRSAARPSRRRRGRCPGSARRPAAGAVSRSGRVNAQAIGSGESLATSTTRAPAAVGDRPHPLDRVAARHAQPGLEDRGARAAGSGARRARRPACASGRRRRRASRAAADPSHGSTAPHGGHVGAPAPGRARR